MNTNIFIYNKIPYIPNFRNDNNEPITNYYIHSSLFEHHFWKTYSNGYMLRYFGIKDFIVNMVLVTNIAYTYRISGEEIFHISPHYIKSLDTVMDWKNCIDKTKLYERTTKFYYGSKFLQEYITLEESGYFKKSKNSFQREYVYSTYRITEKLKELANNLDTGYFINIEAKDIFEKAKRREHLPCIKGRFYIVEDHGIEKEFYSLIDARKYIKTHECTSKPRYIKTPERIIRAYTINRCTYNELHNCNSDNIKKVVKNKANYNTALSSSISVNRSEIEKILSDPKSGDIYSNYVLLELLKMYNATTDENTNIDLSYFRTKQGRYYTIDSAAQLFPKELRERVFSEYVAVDMECSIFTLYKNIARKLGYNKKSPQIDEIIKNRKVYREKFVTPILPYDGVKTILTAIAYGANVDIYNMYMDISNGNAYKKSSLLYAGYDKMSVLNMCNTDEILALTKELHSIGKFIISKFTDKKKKCIFNLCNTELSLKDKPSFGAKLCHIYQSYESAILNELRNIIFKDENIFLGSIDSGIGLYLHDGLYVKREIAEKYDLCKMFSEKIKDVFDFDVKYELE